MGSISINAGVIYANVMGTHQTKGDRQSQDNQSDDTMNSAVQDAMTSFEKLMLQMSEQSQEIL